MKVSANVLCASRKTHVTIIKKEIGMHNCLRNIDTIMT